MWVDYAEGTQMTKAKRGLEVISTNFHSGEVSFDLAVRMMGVH